MQLQDLKVGDKFKMKGLSVNGKETLTTCELVGYNGMNKYIVLNEGITLLLEGSTQVIK